MPTTYKDYNNYSEQDKDSMRTLAADTSNTNESTIISQTDQVESLLSTVIARLETLHADVDQVETKIDAVKTAVQNADTHIVTAIEALPHNS
jgi:hypothetical protein